MPTAITINNSNNSNNNNNEREKEKKAFASAACLLSHCALYLSLFFSVSLILCNFSWRCICCISSRQTFLQTHTQIYTHTHRRMHMWIIRQESTRLLLWHCHLQNLLSLSLSPLLSHLHCCCRVVVVAAAVSLSAAEGLIRYVCEQVTSSA